MEPTAFGAGSASKRYRRARRAVAVNAVRVAVIEKRRREPRNLFRQLGDPGGLEMIGPFDAAEAAVARLKAAAPQVAVVKLGPGGLRAIGVFKQELPELPLIALMPLRRERDVYRALAAGASGCLCEYSMTQCIRSAISDVLDGGIVIEPRLAKRFWKYVGALRAVPGFTPPGPWRLSALEIQILLYLAKGLSNAEVALLLSIGRRSVRTRLSHIYREMGVRSHLSATFLAARAGLIEL